MHLEINHNDWIALENFPPEKVFSFHLFILVLVCRCIYTLHNKNEIWQFKENSLKPKLHYPSLHIIATVNIHEYIHQKDLTNHENSKNHTSFRTCIMAQKKLKENKLSWTWEHELSWALKFAWEHFMRCYKEESTMNGSQGHDMRKFFFLNPWKVFGSLVNTRELSRTLECFQEHSWGPLEKDQAPKLATMAQDIKIK